MILAILILTGIFFCGFSIVASALYLSKTARSNMRCSVWERADPEA